MPKDITTITTERTLFTTPVTSDYGDIWRLYRDKKVRQYLWGVITQTEFDKKFEGILSTTPPEIYRVVRRKETNSLFGLVSLTKHHDKEHFEISYQLHPNCRRKGLGTELVNRAIKYAFDEGGFDELYVETQKKNIASVKLLEKVGMTLVREVDRFGEIQLIYSIKKG